MKVTIKQASSFIDNDIIVDDLVIGKVRLCLEEHEIVQLNIWEPYQNKGYGTQVVKQLISEGYNCLWVTSDNLRAIHVYEKCGFIKGGKRYVRNEIQRRRLNAARNYVIYVLYDPCNH